MKNTEDLRDEIAIRAMQSLIEGRTWGDMAGDVLIDIWAKSAYAVADAMLKVRDKTE